MKRPTTTRAALGIACAYLCSGVSAFFASYQDESPETVALAAISALLFGLALHRRDSFESAKLTTGEFNEP